MHHEAGKGSKQRLTDQETFGNNWDRIFGKKKKDEPEPERSVIEYIKSTYWDGNDHLQGRKAVRDDYSNLEGIQRQLESNPEKVFIFVGEISEPINLVDEWGNIAVAETAELIESKPSVCLRLISVSVNRQDQQK